MNSMAEIFENSKHLLDSVDNFVNKYIGCSLLRKCGITKIVKTEETTDFQAMDGII